MFFPPSDELKQKHEQCKHQIERDFRHRIRPFLDLLEQELMINGHALVKWHASFDNLNRFKMVATGTNCWVNEVDWMKIILRLRSLPCHYNVLEIPDAQTYFIEFH